MTPGNREGPETTVSMPVTVPAEASRAVSSIRPPKRKLSDFETIAIAGVLGAGVFIVVALIEKL